MFFPTHQDYEELISKKLYEASLEVEKEKEGNILGINVQYPLTDFSSFRYLSLDNYNLNNLPSPIAGLNSDGIGTKIEIAERMDKWNTLAFDLFAMVCDDAAASGTLPLAVCTDLSVSKIDLNRLEKLIAGYKKAAIFSNVDIINGEFAVIGNRLHGYSSFTLDWIGTCLWVANKNKTPLSRKINPGDSIIALEETGCRSNGFTRLRDILETHYGDLWHNAKIDDCYLGDLALQPSTIYAPAIIDLLYGLSFDPNGIVHVTGGGIPAKLKRILKHQLLGADIFHPRKPGKLFSHIVHEKEFILEKEAYERWCMGQGMLIIVSEDAVDFVINELLEHQINCSVIGEITSSPIITIRGKKGIHTWEYLTQ